MVKQKIAIFGASGFIGKNLINYLEKNNDFEIVVFSGNLLNKDDVEYFFNNNVGIKQVINLVGIFSGDFKILLDINVIAINNLLEYIKKFNIEKIIHISTGAVYGEPINGTSKENDLLNPNTLYGLTKKYGEDCIKYNSIDNSFKYIILRFPNVYGPGSNKGVIYNFIRSIKENKNIIVFGNGEQRRNFLYIDDAIKSIIKSLYYENNCIFNIADNESYTLNEVIEKIKKYSFEFNVIYKEEDKNNSLRILSEDIRLAKEKLCWQPIVNIENGIKETIFQIN